jgi:hypothetical protein
MSDQDHEPTVTNAVDDADQPGEGLDAEKLPDEFPDRPMASFDYGTTEEEMAHDEPLNERLLRELPDFGESAEPGEQPPPTQLLDDAGVDGHDNVKDLVAEAPLVEPEQQDDSGRPDVPPSAEEAAMRVEDTDDVPGAVDHPPVLDG